MSHVVDELQVTQGELGAIQEYLDAPTPERFGTLSKREKLAVLAWTYMMLSEDEAKLAEDCLQELVQATTPGL